MRVFIVTPAGRGTRNGNRNTAVRWAHLLRSLGRTRNLVFLVIEPLMKLTPQVHSGAKSFKRSLWRAKQRILGQA